MLKQVFLGRFEPVVARFGPYKIPKCLEGDFPALFTFIGHDIFDFSNTSNFAQNISNFVLDECIESLKDEMILWEA